MSILDLLTVVVLVFVGSRIVRVTNVAARGGGRARVLGIVRGLRWRHFLAVPPVAAVVIAAALALLQVPVLRFGWWSAIGGQGNPALGVTASTEGSALGLLVPLGFALVLIPALPLLAEREEVAFRLGAEHWSQPKRAAKGVLFGLAHAVIGIPVGVALALSIGGWYFTWAYLRGVRRGGPAEGLAESTRAHLAYNACLVGLFLVSLLATIADLLLH